PGHRGRRCAHRLQRVEDPGLQRDPGLGPRGYASGLGGGTAALSHDQLDPIGGDLGGIRPIPGGSGLPLGGALEKMRDKLRGTPSSRRSRPKLRPVRQVISLLTWVFPGMAGQRSGYVKVRGIGAPIRVKASRWVLVGSVSIGTVASVPANRTWLRGRVARCSSRPRKLR